jgi:phospholipase D-like protein
MRIIYTAAMARLIIGGVAVAVVSGAIGYWIHAPASSINEQTVSAPPANSVRVIYSLTAKRNDREVIALINSAQSHVYFAMYEFTLRDIADALVAAKRRGIDVEGVVDSVESGKSYGQPIVAELTAAKIPVKVEHHADANGIMHIKAIATDKAYAIGSYNWTASATTENDELLEIGNSPELVKTYNSILKRLIDSYSDGAAIAAAPAPSGEYDYTQASKHIGEYASVRGTLVDAHSSASGTMFLDFCKSYRNCPFSGVIFADDAKQFGDLSKYVGTEIALTGKISSYQSRAEIIVREPNQIQADRAPE